MKGRVCVPDVEDLRKLIMEEVYCSTYVMHPGSIKENHMWFAMKKDIADFMSKCLVCQQVKAEHQKSPRTFHSLPIPE